MLFNGEAIFGAVDFEPGSGAAARRVAEIVDKASSSGLEARTFAAGNAVLGRAAFRSGTANFDDRADSRDVWAIACGELLDRQHRSDMPYHFEPARSVFLAEGVGAEGLSFMRRIDGTFAAAVWSQNERQLTLLVDRRADCRLYYRAGAGQVTFSSWLPFLRNDAAEIDPQAVAEFLRFLYIAPPRTIYRGISSVEPGCYVAARPGQIETTRLAGQVSSSSSSQQSGEILADFQFLLEQAVARRLGQRRTGVFLSSGVDSAAVLAAAQKLNPGGVEAFTVGFDAADLDETRAAQSLARQLGVPHYELRYDLDKYHEAFHRIARGFEQPFGDPAALPLVLASQSLSDRVEVITGGTGGDDLFGSPIPRHLWFSSAIAGRLPRALRIPLARVAGAAGVGEIFEFDDLEELFVTWKGWSKRDLGELLGVTPNFAESGFYRAFRDHRGAEPQALYDALGVFPPDDCRFESAALARRPIELPYHDADLTAYVRTLPASWRTSNGDTKIVLRRLFAQYFPQGRLPEKKRYFNIPLQALMARGDFALIKECLAPERLKRVGLVEPDRTTMWINRFIAGEEDLRFKIWALLVLHAWTDARPAA
jgi:asparagine synthase (glutamine-hydrolysing)